MDSSNEIGRTETSNRRTGSRITQKSGKSEVRTGEIRRKPEKYPGRVYWKTSPKASGNERRVPTRDRKIMSIVKTLFTIGGLADRFAWISDIHIDPLYDPRANQETYCRKNGEVEPLHHKFGANVGRLDAGFEIRKPVVTIPAYHGRYGCDPPVSLVRSMLSSMESTKPQFTLVTGDFAAHYWGEGSKKLRWQALKNATHELYSGLIDQRFIFCVGNNDVGRDYQPQSNSSWNQKLFDLWSPRSVPPDQHHVINQFI